MSWLNNLFSRKKTLEESLKGKSSNEILELLKKKYPNPPRYIDLSKFTYSSKIPGQSIDTSNWKYVIPEYSKNNYTGNWFEQGESGILNYDDFISELLLNKEPLIPTTAAKAAAAAEAAAAAKAKAAAAAAAAPPAPPDKLNGGRRPRRLTIVKSKKSANKRRTRSRK